MASRRQCDPAAWLLQMVYNWERRLLLLPSGYCGAWGHPCGARQICDGSHHGQGARLMKQSTPLRSHVAEGSCCAARDPATERRGRLAVIFSGVLIDALRQRLSGLRPACGGSQTELQFCCSCEPENQSSAVCCETEVWGNCPPLYCSESAALAWPEIT